MRLRPMRIEWYPGDDQRPLDVWRFRALERLKVHEARTAAELCSAVVRHAEPVRRIRWMHAR